MRLIEWESVHCRGIGADEREERAASDVAGGEERLGGGRRGDDDVRLADCGSEVGAFLGMPIDESLGRYVNSWVLRVQIGDKRGEARVERAVDDDARGDSGVMRKEEREVCGDLRACANGDYALRGT